MRRSRAVRISIDKGQLGILTTQWSTLVKLQRLCLMNRRMLFKLGVSVVVGVAIILFYMVNVQEERSRTSGRAYRKLVLGSSPDFVSSYLSHNLRQRSDQEFLKKHAEAIRIHTELSEARIGTGEDSVRQAKIDDRLFEDSLSIVEKAKKEPVHLLDEFAEGTKNNSKKRDSRKSNQVPSHKKIDKSVLNDPRKEHDFKFESEHFSANIKRDGAVSGSSAVHLCVVVCGTRGQETMTMLKSATMVTPLNISLIFHIFAEPEIQNFFQDELDLWPLVHRHRLSYHIYNVTFPDSSTTNAWKKLFKPCASQRLFLPNLLQSVERLIYVDTDTVFLESLTHLWEMFNDFNSSQLAGLVGEAEAGYAAWYNRFANHPFYGKFGLNSGVMLMDLNRLRQTSWLSDMQRLFLQYRLALPWGDQDLINIYFAFHPDQMYLMPCKWNYRNDHCRYSSNCVSAEESGVSVLHGSRRTFESGKEPVLQIIHRAFSKYQLGDDMEFHFLENLVAELEDVKHTASNCWKASSFFLIQLKLLKERNREFMQASRKANQRLSSGRRQSRSGSRQKDVDMGHVYHQPGHSQRAGAKGQPLPKNQKKLTERWERTESEEQLTREKLFMSKSKRDVPLQTQREESVEGQIDGRNRVSFHLRGNETDKSDEIFKLRKIERNSSKLTDSKENLRRQKTGDKHSSYQRHPGDDHVNLTRLKSSAVMSKEKGKNHNKSGSSVHEKAARPDDLSVPKDSAQNSVLKADSDLDLTNDIFHRAADGSHKSAKSVLKMAVDHTGEQGVHEEGLKKRMPKIEEQKIDYDDTDDRDEMQKVFMSVRESERKSEKKPFLNAQI